jgi:hypothetical protein
VHDQQVSLTDAVSYQCRKSSMRSLSSRHEGTWIANFHGIARSRAAFPGLDPERVLSYPVKFVNGKQNVANRTCYLFDARHESQNTGIASFLSQHIPSAILLTLTPTVQCNVALAHFIKHVSARPVNLYYKTLTHVPWRYDRQSKYVDKENSSKTLEISV